MQETEIWPYEQMVYAQPRICPRNWDEQIQWDFKIQTDHAFSARRTELVIVKKKKKKEKKEKRKETLVTLKESEKNYEYVDLARELKNRGTWK